MASNSKNVDPAAISLLETHELLEDLTDRGGNPNVTIRQIAQKALTEPGYLEEVGRHASSDMFYFRSTSIDLSTRKLLKLQNRPKAIWSTCIQDKLSIQSTVL